MSVKAGDATLILSDNELRRRFERHSKPAASDDVCWPWTGPLHDVRSESGSYGRLGYKGQYFIASRMALTLSLGRAIQPSMFACHTCDHPRCINPQHLFEGTAAHNNYDKMLKGRCRLATHCPKGHEYAGDNLVFERRGAKVRRLCRECRREIQRNRYQRALSEGKLSPSHLSKRSEAGKKMLFERRVDRPEEHQAEWAKIAAE